MQFIYIDLVRPISSIGFGKKRYFFTFMDDHIHHIEIYTGAKKATSSNICGLSTISAKSNLKKNNPSNDFGQITGRNSKVKELKNNSQKNESFLNFLFFTFKNKTKCQSGCKE